MAQLTVRGLDEALVRKLKIRAAENGRSAEAEHRRILEDALGARPETDWWEEARRMREESLAFGPQTDSGEITARMRHERTEWLEELSDATRPRRRRR